MYISTEHIDAEVENMSDQEHHQEQDAADDAASEHGTHLIEDRRHDARCQAQGQQS